MRGGGSEGEVVEEYKCVKGRPRRFAGSLLIWMAVIYFVTEFFILIFWLMIFILFWKMCNNLAFSFMEHFVEIYNPCYVFDLKRKCHVDGAKGL